MGFFFSFEKKKPNVFHMLLGQTPLVLCICMFTGIFLAYQNQELGNLPIECISPYTEGIFE